jgi:aspartyl-tRNA(Asn)/glutamyl-tRNA(Gln) amidotransferase subunit A
MNSMKISQIQKMFSENPDLMTGFYENILKNIESQNPEYNSITHVYPEIVKKRIEELSQIKNPQDYPLYGVPIVIKENIQKKNYSVQCASKILEGYLGQYDSTVVSSLEKSGAIIIGTANMDEFAMGSSNEYSIHGPVRNPFDKKRVSGGSSGGSAVSCALGFASVTLGSDTGGSVRQPAAFCGIYGYKPTYGRVSRYGLVAYGSSLDQISPFTTSVDDLDTVMKVIGQTDPKDATTLLHNYQGKKDCDLSQIKVGIMPSLWSKGVDKSIVESIDKTIDQMKKLGVTIKNIDIPTIHKCISTYYIIASAEASSNLARFDGVRYGYREENSQSIHELYTKSRSKGFGKEVKKRIMLGTFTLSQGHYDAFYEKGQQVRNYLKKEIAKAWDDVDFILLPTTPTLPFSIGEKCEDTLFMYLNDLFTVPANLTGIPAISCPMIEGDKETDLPIGLQFYAPYNEDEKLIGFAHALEEKQLFGHHRSDVFMNQGGL